MFGPAAGIPNWLGMQLAGSCTTLGCVPVLQALHNLKLGFKLGSAWVSTT